MFPHTITIYRHKEVSGADVITRQVVDGFYWYGSKASKASGKGATEDDTVAIVSSPERANDYGTAWTVEPRDRVVKGTGAEVISLKDINGITVLRVEENLCGCPVDNITITGK